MTTISFKVSPKEALDIRARAKRERITVSEFLRRQAAAPSPSPQKSRLSRCPYTGAMVFDPIESSRPLTVESTREYLSDYP